mmetsp:Transcript_22546/g.64932  ORF Transcript_22546/g.64932 Transcript_22546/m.64932 type:complete len:118 (-) Transcript_22546:92-445(-)
MVSGRIFSELVGKKLHQTTKQALLNSPTFVRFAQESSKAAEGALKEAMRKAEPAISSAREEVMRKATPALASARNEVAKKAEPAWESIRSGAAASAALDMGKRAGQMAFRELGKRMK